MTATTPRYLDEAAVRAAISPAQAVDAVQDALRAGFDPGMDHARVFERLTRGQFLLMPSEVGPHAGIKVLTVSPNNPGHGLPRIQGLYILFDAETLSPTLLLDGAALTSIRTPAVSFAATATALLRSPDPLDVVIFGAGPQATEHLATLRAVLGEQRSIASVTVVARTARIVDIAQARVVEAGSTEASEAVAIAGLIVCATTARTPVFDSTTVRSDVVVVAVGSHEPNARELDGALMARAQVVVEDVLTAVRESGDVVMAIDEGALTSDDLIPVADVVRGTVQLDAERPIVFKSSGMSWEDLAIASAIASATGRTADAA
ncbi:ornithine cyclodeaminase [Rhodoglobus vestalii]|uniref:Ornithine cyclodeaminase n=1 Tax=Rhodoglobus vestalii TaxID=193384 RepID=A0A8H2K8D7_9MICO|nr:ornithine cyclodeaminase family protein [Rhodoglobus vestalii]TQO19556.1 ornithine cyclodeaminase [Rhodoglobus vestalii]